MNELPQFVGRFPILDLLGVGGMGIVYLAEDPDIGRKVAIKVLHASENNLALDRFKNEARTIGELSHPNIVMLLEYGVENNSPYLVMEYLPGISLEEWTKSPHSLAEHKKVLIGLCKALKYAHNKNILHRDLKLGNVQVLPNGDSKLLDFGIARSQDAHLTTTGFFVGTPKYLAPEILSSSDHSSVSDCYSLGLIAYSIFCNRDPYKAPTFEGIVARKLTITPMELSKINPAIPEKLSQVIASYLEKEPEARPQATEALESVLSEMTSTDELERVIYYKQTSNESSDDETLIAQKKPSKKGIFYFAALVLMLSITLASYLFYPFYSQQGETKENNLSNKIITGNDETSSTLGVDRNTGNLTEHQSSKNKSSDNKLVQNIPEKPLARQSSKDLKFDKKTSKLPQKLAESAQIALQEPSKKHSTDGSTKLSHSNSKKNKGLATVQIKTSNTNTTKEPPKKAKQKATPPIQQDVLQKQQQERSVATHVIIPKLVLQPISRKSNRIKLKLISTNSLPRGKTVKLKINLSENVAIRNFKFFRGRKQLTQISILKVETLKARELLLHLYVDPNTKLGEYSLVGYYKNKKTNALSIEVTL